MGETSRKAVLLAAAAWNVVGGASALLDPPGHFAQLFTASLSLDDPLQRFFFRCVWINVIAWGLAYLIAAFRPFTRSTVLTAGGIGKFAYFLACLSAFDSGLGKAALLAAALADLLFAALFAAALIAPRALPNDAALSRELSGP